MNVVKNREVVKSEPLCAKNTCRSDLWLVLRLLESPMLVEGQIELLLSPTSILDWHYL